MFDNEELLKSLSEALDITPENTVLRNQYAKMLISRGLLDKAEETLRDGLKLSPESEQLKLVLSDCFRKNGNASAALVILEELLGRPNCPASTRIIYARMLMAQGEIETASTSYRRAIEEDESLADEELAAALGVSSSNEWDDNPDIDKQGRVRIRNNDDQSNYDINFDMEKPKVNFDDVGGMDNLKEQIRLKIIEPMKNPEIYKAYGKPIGGSLLMYGPPGCGKTHLARATAGQVDASFINVGLHHVLDMYIGSSEQRLHSIFEYARNNKPCIIFFDEVDALGASRSDMRQSAGRNLINQFLSELDGIDSNNEDILIMAATNAPWHLDPAFRRPGRFDRLLFVHPPDESARAAILRVLLRDKPQEEIDYQQIAKKTNKFSGADLKAVIDQAIELKLNDALKSGVPSPLSTKDLQKAAKTTKTSTSQWFSSARNYALYANDGGMYDEILEYLNIKL